jgi:predicted amidohydrolase YtcJ
VEESIYAGGDTVTVNDAQSTVEALAVKDGKILTMGCLAEIEGAHNGESTCIDRC